jgi:uncharacterized membrane protein
MAARIIGRNLLIPLPVQRVVAVRVEPMRTSVTMPRWPAWIMLGFAAACAYPAVTNPPPRDPALERYEARGNEPGWRLLIRGKQLEFTPAGGKTITVVEPFVRASFNGLRYESPRLTVDVTYSRCNDDMSGQGFEHHVMVMRGAKTFSGCGGERRPDWDL